MKTQKEKHFENYDVMMSVFGELDENIERLTDAFDVDVFAMGTGVKVSGEEKDVEGAIRAIDALEKLCKKQPLSSQSVNMVIGYAKAGKDFDVEDLMGTVAITARGKIIRPKTLGQKKYVDAIKRSSIVFGVGPAGTGKTYLAVALAVYALKNKEIDKIILTRPAVEAGEKLGFLPGDMNEKVDPYLRPLFDALQEMMGQDAYLRHIERGSIEIAPLAYMRGRTLSNSFIILDEAQNTTKEQMKMFLTRMGENSRIVVTGDVTQIDLPKNVKSGMIDAIEVLDGVEGIEIVKLTAKDVVRHELVTRIIQAYEKAESARAKVAKEESDD
ncbi:MAG: PhoH family protein [Christensenellales bacterium]|nr:PhoH family protein [Clostridia bacterium]